MTGADALYAVLARIGAAYDGAAFFSVPELREWPKVAVSVFEKAGLLTRGSPARSVTCDGCERQCRMPVEIVSRADRRSAAFVVCDKRDDINRVDVPLERLEQWQTSGEAVAAFLALTLDINRASGVATQGRGWSVGLLRGKHAAHLVLRRAQVLTLDLAGHAVPLIEVLSFKSGRLELRRQRLIDCADHPVAGGGIELPEERRARLVARRDQLKARRVRDFLKVMSGEEGISESRLKQLLRRKER